MDVVTSEQSSSSDKISSSNRRRTFISLLSHWELYLLLLITLFLHFAYIQTFEFDDDQAALLRMAHDAIHYGLVPAVSNVSSINIAHPPGTIYLFMIPELFTPNPLAANIFVAICTTIAIFLTYFFVNRYYGRVAAIATTLLYATATRPLIYARFIWQPNLMPPFVILFMFALFEGVVKRRKGWIFPALVLYGVLYQMHPTAVLLAAPLCVALILAPETFRWRDVGLAFVCLLIIFSPYLLYEYLTKFIDVTTVLTLSKQPSHFDSQALYFYRLFLSPGDENANYPGSLLTRVSHKLFWFGYVSLFLVVVGAILILVLIILPRSRNRGGVQENLASSSLQRFFRGWTSFRTDGYKCGFVLLLVWQIVPLVVLSRHSIALHAQYFFLLFPGPFILIGILVAKVVEWTRQQRLWTLLIRYGMYGLITVLILGQLVGSVAIVVDTGRGIFNDRVFYPYHNALNSLQNALSAADQLAQQRHLGRVYITTDAATQSAFRYLTEGSKTPTTLFDASSCLVLPNPSQGAAVFLVGPYDALTNAMLTQLSSATLVQHLPRLGGSPFSLYVVSSRPANLSNSAFEGNLQAIDQKAAQVNAGSTSWLVSQWQLLRSQASSHLTTYNYVMHVTSAQSGQNTKLGQATCTLSSLQTGDQLLIATHYPKNMSNLTTINTSVQYYTQVPHNLSFGSITLGTDQTASTPWEFLPVTGGKQHITINV